MLSRLKAASLSRHLATPAARARTMASSSKVTYLSAKQAQEIDQVLMSDEGAYTLEQLMELAGLACALCVQHCYPPGPDTRRVLVCCGPGNQGGDGLVAARHLALFGYRPAIFWPKEGKNDFYQKLKKQCENMDLPLIAPPPSTASTIPMAPGAQENEFRRSLAQADIIIDAVFGFSFKPPPREPFIAVLDEFKKTDKPIISVDVPSGWDVERGNINDCFTPSVLISLTAPKMGVKEYAESGGAHFLGGRFVPPELARRLRLNLPPYPEGDQIVDITVRD